MFLRKCRHQHLSSEDKRVNSMFKSKHANSTFKGPVDRSFERQATTSFIQDTNEQRVSSLFNILPAELRIHIYSFIVPSSQHIKITYADLRIQRVALPHGNFIGRHLMSTHGLYNTYKYDLETRPDKAFGFYNFYRYNMETRSNKGDDMSNAMATCQRMYARSPLPYNRSAPTTRLATNVTLS